MKVAEKPVSTGLIWLIAGFLVWTSALSSLYAVLSVGCVLGWERIALGPVSVQRLVLILVWAAHIFVLVLILLENNPYSRHASLRKAASQEPDRFLGQVTWASTIAALGATLWTGAPLLQLVQASACV